MLYLGIDLHRKQMTIDPRGEDGEVLLRRQVSTWGNEPAKFLAEVQSRAGDAGYAAVLENCGFHDWLTELLPQYGSAKSCRSKPTPGAAARPTAATPIICPNSSGSTVTVCSAGSAFKGCGGSSRRPPAIATTAA